MADVCLSSSLENFGPEAYFFVMQASPKTGGHMLMTKIGNNRSDWYP